MHWNVISGDICFSCEQISRYINNYFVSFINLYKCQINPKRHIQSLKFRNFLIFIELDIPLESYHPFLLCLL